MPRDFPSIGCRQRVAVVGGGISGLAAAWLLGRTHDVTLFEQADRLGGHANTVEVAGPEGPIAVDTGFIVYNESNYPNLTALFAHLGVATQASDMSFAVSIDAGTTEYSSSGPLSLFAPKRNAFRPRFWRMVTDLLRFYRDGPALLTEPHADRVSLGAYLLRERYSPAFVEDHLLPMAAAIWSTPVEGMRDYPAAAFIRFAVNHGLMSVSSRPQWRTVTGGSRAYIARLVAAMSGVIRQATPVAGLDREGAAVVVADHRGNRTAFDQVVVAIQADQALRLLRQPTLDESRLLGAFRYSRNHAVLHGDVAWMPRRRRAWASWNYLAQRAGAGSSERDLCVTYWMNRLQSLDGRVPLFVTLNPWAPPQAPVYGTFTYDHPSYDGRAIAAQRQLGQIQGRDRIWYCGSYFGAGFHEDALVSGLAAAEALGRVQRPWSIAPTAADHWVVPA